MFMNAYKIRSLAQPLGTRIVTADGSIVLKGLPFNVGKSVEVIAIDDISDSPIPTLDERWKSLRGSVTRYDDPFESALS